MKQITVGSGVVEKFGELIGQAIICDEQGRALGFYSPLAKATPLDELQLEPNLSMEELRELRKDRTGKPLSEILDRLGLA
jgi:hypothetical protein